jgi:hypothetical protein
MNSGGGGIGFLMEGEGCARACAARCAAASSSSSPADHTPQKNLSTANKTRLNRF